MSMRQILPVLEYISQLSPRQQKQFIRVADPQILLAISDLCKNLNEGAIDVSSDSLKKLKKYKTQILFLCKKKPTAKQRRRVLQRGGLFSSILQILPAVVGAIFAALGQKP